MRVYNRDEVCPFRFYSGIRFIPDCLGLFKKVQVFQYIR